MTFIETLHTYNEIYTATQNEKDPEKLQVLKSTMKKLLGSEVLLFPVGSQTMQYL
jgi:hypothetical protein